MPMESESEIEMLDIVDEHNVVIGSGTKEDIYEKKLLHRIVHVFVLHPHRPEIYLQKRAATKAFLPNYYCTSAGGHVHAGETHEQAAVRELEEEIGITTPIHEVDSFLFTGENGHQRLVKVFTTMASDGFLFTDGEVSEGRFFSIPDAMTLIDTNVNIHPQLTACFRRLHDHHFFDFYQK